MKKRRQLTRKPSGGVSDPVPPARRAALIFATLTAITVLLHVALIVAKRNVFLIGSTIPGGLPRDETALDRAGLCYAVCLVGLLVCYVLVLKRSENGKISSALARRIAIAAPVSMSIALIFVRPYFSIDLFVYVQQGYVTDPYTISSGAILNTDLGRELQTLGWIPWHGTSPYGPIWNAIASLATRTGSVTAAALLLKIVACVMTLGSGWLVYLIAQQVTPQHAFTQILAFLWNPLLISELAHEAHNDSPMIFFSLLAILFIVQRRAGPAGAAISAGVLVKYLPALIIPPMLVYWWRTRRPETSARASLVWIMVISIVALLAFGLFGSGKETFAVAWNTATGRYLQFQSSMPFAVSSWATQLGLSEDSARLATILTLRGALLATLLVASARVRDPKTLIASAAIVLLAYELLTCLNHWPWHGALPIAFLVLLPRADCRAMVVLLCVTQGFVAPLDAMHVNGWFDWSHQVWWMTWVAIVIPALCLIGFGIGRLFLRPAS